MALRQTKTGTRKLSEVARHIILPAGITSTGWPSVRDKARDMGITYDGWQDGIGRAILAKRENGLYAAGIGGAIISVARQVGKTFLIGSMIFALCILMPGLKVLWTAHRIRTSDETFKSMQGFARRVKIAPFVRYARQANGQQEIAFKNGSRILFGARESGFGRGFDDVDVVVFDEAQILAEKAMDDMVPTTNTAKNPLILLLGTPPKPTDRSEVFTNRRREALEGEFEDGLYVEISADRGADPNDRKQWRKGNPSYPHRTPEAAMLRMWKQLGTESFLREGLGIWDEQSLEQSAISAQQWRDTAIGLEDVPDGVASFGVRFSPDGTWVSVAVAVKPPEGPIFVELLASQSMVHGTDWLVEYLTSRRSKISTVIIDGKSDAAALTLALRAKRWPRMAINLGKDMMVPQSAAEAYSTLVNAVRTRNLTHLDDPGQAYLDESVEGSKRRPIGTAGAFGFGPITDESDPTPIEAVALARWGAELSKRTPSGAQRKRAGGAVIM